MELAEDVAQEAFSRALALWKTQAPPSSPGAWLMATAKNQALDVLRRERTARRFAPELGRLLESEWTLAPLLDEAFSPSSLRDEQLRMMFSCCHPRLPEETQLALILNILCGFSAQQLSSALLTRRAAIEKRIARGKRALATARKLFDLADADFLLRLDTVRRALYLLFSEGYHGASEAAVRGELCREAIHLAQLLCEHPPAATPSTHALCALMCLQAARLPARLDAVGDFNPLAAQDRSRWDERLLGAGLTHFERSASGDTLSGYHLEAAIAAAHAGAGSMANTDWRLIASLYERLMSVAPSPVVALNRAIAIAERDGAGPGLQALLAIENRERLANYPFYPAALGELLRRLGDHAAAVEYFRQALALARNEAERRFLRKQLQRSSS